MEILKKSCSLLLTAICMVQFAFAQSFDEKQKAYSTSYTAEYKGDYKSAISAIEKINSNDSYESNLRLGWLYYKSKSYIKSMEYYQNACNLKKYSVEARLGYVYPANANGNFDKAYLKYEEVLKIDPYNSTANYWVGVNYYNIKKYDAAAKYFELVVNMHPFDYDANHMLAWCYINLGRNADAKILFEKALLIKPNDSSASEGLKKSQ